MDAKRRLHLIGRRRKNGAKEPFCGVRRSRGQPWALQRPTLLSSISPTHPLGTLIELVRATCTRTGNLI